MESDLLGNPNVIRYLSNFFYFIRDKRILIIGAGGGGDVCGCLPTYYWIKQCGGHPILGSLTWERTDVLWDYGPRSFDQIEGLTEITGTVAWGNGTTAVKKNGIRFQASRISEVIDLPVVYLDLTQGVQSVVKDLTQFCTRNNISYILPIDVGGDIIARGIEPGLRTPLADSMTLSVIAQIPIPKALGIFGLNCDGELTLAELQDYLQEFNLKDWVYGQRLHTDDEFVFMENTITTAEAITEASWQPIRYLHGERGNKSIRHGTRNVQLEEIILHSFFVRLDEIYPSCPIANAIANTQSIEEANSIILTQFEIDTEYEYEKRCVQNNSN